jgi:hypothetical protein
MALQLIAISVLAQKPREVGIGPDEDAAESFPYRDKYMFSEFQSGFLITREGKRSKPLLLNYNVFSGVPQFIGEKGDTLFLDDHVASYVQIKDITFIHEFPKGYYEFVLKTSPVRLAVQRTWKRDRVEPGFDGEGRGAGIEKNVSVVRTQNTIYSKRLGRHVRNETVIFRRDSSYFFVDSKDRIYPSGESNLLKLFEAGRPQIKEWLKQADIDFDNEEDLRKVFEFCIPLVSKN